MKLEWIRDFRSLAETGSFSRSAEIRNTTQSAFSRRIKALEDWLGSELVDRSTHPVKLTDAGQVFYGVSVSVEETLEIGRTQTLQAARQRGGAIIVTATHTMASTFFPTWLQTLEFHLGQLPTRLDCNTAERCFDNLAQGRAHFALCPIPDLPLMRLLPAERLPYVVVGQDELIPVSTTDAQGCAIHAIPSSKKYPVQLLSIAEGSLLGGAVRRLIASRSKDAPIFYETVFESSLKEAVQAMALRGQGLAWLPRSLVSGELASGVLISAGDKTWNVPFQIRFYRSNNLLPLDGERLWTYLNGERTLEAPRK
ncbi:MULTISPECIES: LysR family transcriptional regulator [unclassified Methylobacterium]|uniref:LysR family transcriptional regulator n=1 Tax=unclassified Methylobacterium TaxID=2615210 RepID=UPI0036F7A492